jgi:hypothetical protein
MRAKIITVLACIAIAPLAFGQTSTKHRSTTAQKPTETQAPTPAANIQTVTAFTRGEFIEVQSALQTQPVKYVLAKNTVYVDAAGKAIDPSKIRPGTRVRLENKGKGRRGVYRRVVVVQPQ